MAYSGLATVQVTVTAVNDTPVADALGVTTSEDTSTSITLSGSDVESPLVSFELVSVPSKGVLSGTLPNLTYTPSPDAVGLDGFAYRTFDGVAYSAVSTVSIVIAAVNDSPSFAKGTPQSAWDDAGGVTVTGLATSISAGPSDESGQGLAFLVSTSNAGLFAVPPSISSGGTLTYTPALHASGTATVTVRLQDTGGTESAGEDTSAAQTFSVTVRPRPRVVERGLYYGGSTWDVGGTLGNEATAPDKQALRPGYRSMFANVSSYIRGINGMFLDVHGLQETPSAAVLEFRVGLSRAGLAHWAQAPSPTGLVVRKGAGAGGSDRIVLTCPDYSIRNTWLEARLLPSPRTGLATADVFYFASVIGETGDPSTELVVSATDVTRARLAVGVTSVGRTSAFDVNRDGFVNSTDVILIRLNQTVNLATQVQVLDLTNP